LEPVYQAHLQSILESQVLAMNETPIKAGWKQRPPLLRGQMKRAYFWPVYGDRDEIAFSCAYTPYDQMRNNTLAGLFQENARLIYEYDNHLNYVSLEEKSGEGGFTTASYELRSGGKNMR